MPRLPHRPVTSALLGLGLVIGAATTTAGAVPAFAVSTAPAATSGSVVAESTSAPLSAITAGGITALAKAQAAVAGAAKVSMDITASGLDVGRTDIVIDTTKLSALVDKLQALEVTPAMMIPSLTADATAETEAVRTQTADLRSALDAAKQRKAEADAAAKAAAEAAAAQAAAEAAAAAAAAQAQAEAEAAAAAKASSASASVPSVDVNVDPASAQGIARSMAAASYGWGDDQFACLVSLWNKESGWRVNAANSSGAYGIPQALPGSKMASAGADWETNPATQIAWGLGYISGRYGTPCGAWDHSESVGWY
ncbi:lytic transglycosylase domain-containing protein [Microbacterium hominis]|uniref:Lytic transglycosylase domain-containing protein n=1 Tax=Microbacterium hominis TaxID=162426 RepID=A0A2K9D928_9MICO|nr:MULTISPECIES: lytic transglycosylase domain-containing protein [Microbacterium]AUG28611.1 lytic transglycosylase domain-containing protein [Microbacterium hominis]QRY40138.1 lytic transglycosylase domain-containing protein [Microbacterium hominis]